MRTKIDFTGSRESLEDDAREFNLRVVRVQAPGSYHTHELEWPQALLEGSRANLKRFLYKHGYDFECHPIMGS